MEIVRPRVPGIFEPETASFGTRVWEPAVTVEATGKSTTPARRIRRRVEDIRPKLEHEAEGEGATEPKPARDDGEPIHRARPEAILSGAIRDMRSPHEDGDDNSQTPPRDRGHGMIENRGPVSERQTGREHADADPKQKLEEHIMAETGERAGRSSSPVNTDAHESERWPSSPDEVKRFTEGKRRSVPARGDAEEIAARKVRDKLNEPAPRPAFNAVPEPTIHVSIGRVEVRAVQESSAAARRSREASPVMSLDDYLQQRAAKGTGR
jgi:hypothetical protein